MSYSIISARETFLFEVKPYWRNLTTFNKISVIKFRAFNNITKTSFIEYKNCILCRIVIEKTNHNFCLSYCVLKYCIMCLYITPASCMIFEFGILNLHIFSFLHIKATKDVLLFFNNIVLIIAGS